MVRGSLSQAPVQRGQNAGLALTQGQMEGVPSPEGGRISEAQSRSSFKVGWFKLQHLQPFLTQRLESAPTRHKLVGANNPAAAFQGECRSELSVNPTGGQPGACLLLQKEAVRRCCSLFVNQCGHQQGGIQIDPAQ